MGLGAVLVDRARQLAVVGTGTKVDGTTQTAPVEGPWFPCRLELPGTPETDGPGGGPKRTVKAPRIFYRPLAPDGTLVALKATDKIEIVSPELGTAVWQATGDPEPWRKKRRVLAWAINLQRVDEHPRVDLDAPPPP